MAKDQGIVQSELRRRTPLAGASAAGGVPTAPGKRRLGLIGFFTVFLPAVRNEARKVTWTSWKETWITSVMVGIMVILTAFFFFGVDAVLNLAIGAVLKLASA